MTITISEAVTGYIYYFAITWLILLPFGLFYVAFRR